MAKVFNSENSIKKNYGDNTLYIDSDMQLFSDKECIIKSNIDTLLIDKSWNFPLRKFVDGKLITLPKNIHTLYIGSGSKRIFSCDFNQSIDYLHNGLEKFMLNSTSFNQPLDNLPSTLTQLKINCNQVKNIDVSYLTNLKKLESYTSNFVSIPRSVYHLILNNPTQILDLNCNVSILEINQLKSMAMFYYESTSDTLGKIPDSVEHLIIKSIKDYSFFQHLTIGISTIQITEFILKACEKVLNNLPSSLTLIKISVDKSFCDFTNKFIQELEKIEKIEKNMKEYNEHSENLLRLHELYNIMKKIKLPFGCNFIFCSD